METFFLACFAFGALFTLASVALGVVGHALPGAHGADAGQLGDGGHDLGALHSGHPGHDLSGLHAGPAGHDLAGTGPAHGGAAPGAAGAAGQIDASAGQHVGHPVLPIVNVSSLLGFLTAFGAVGYSLLAFAGWSAVPALVGAVLGGAGGAVVIARFLAVVLKGERIMNPRDYRLEGTIARVTVGISPGGVGEIVFTKAGTRRSEAARSLSDRPILRDTEVVILKYERGVASVEPWKDLVESDAQPALDRPDRTAGGSA